MAAFRLGPVAGYPFPSRREIPPDPADPDKVTTLLVPCPITRNPCDVISLKPLLRGDFLDHGRRCLVYDDAHLGVERNGPGERLVHRASRQDLCPRRVAGVLGFRDVDRHELCRAHQHRREQAADFILIRFHVVVLLVPP